MKVLKIVGGLILILLLLVVVLGLIGPKESNVEESIVIDAPQEMIYEQVSDYKKFYDWSPWREKDPATVVEFSGEMGQKGSKYTWKSEVIGNGSMELVELAASTTAMSEMHIDMGSMGEIVSTTGFTITETEGGNKVVWSIHSDIPFMFRGMALFMDFNEQVRPDFVSGLKSLKELCETKVMAQKKADEDNKANGAYEVTELDFEGLVYYGVSGKGISDFESFQGGAFGNVIGFISKLGLDAKTPPSSLISKWDEATMTADMFAGMGFETGTKIQGLESVVLPASKMLTVDYYGPYDGVQPAHNALHAYMEANGFEMNGPAIEEYEIGPKQEKDPSRWLTKVKYPVKQKES